MGCLFPNTYCKDHSDFSVKKAITQDPVHLFIKTPIFTVALVTLVTKLPASLTWPDHIFHAGMLSLSVQATFSTSALRKKGLVWFTVVTCPETQHGSAGC